ncbi:MAG: polymer-forming cytoskeletal protein [Oscillospiraceae bacterium]
MKENPKLKNENKPIGGVGKNKPALFDFSALAGLSKDAAKEPPPVASEAPPTPSEIAQSVAPVWTAPPPPPAPVQETSLIAAGVVVEGTIRTEGALDCRGVVKGDLIAKGSIVLSGKQIGNIQGLQVQFLSASIEGNVHAKEHVSIDSGTKIIGDIQGGSILLDGQVTGLICGEGLVCLRKNAVLDGDIQAGALAIEQGAQLVGKVTMKLTESR